MVFQHLRNTALNFIYEYRGTADLAEVLKYVEENEGKVTLMTTSDKVKTSFDKKSSQKTKAA